MIRPTSFGLAFYNAMLKGKHDTPIGKMVFEAVVKPGNGMLKVPDISLDAGVKGRQVQRG